MNDQDRMPRRFGVHASVIQLLVLFIASTFMDAHITQKACTISSLLFWTCSALLLWWHEGSPNRVEIHLLRWGLLPVVLIGTPLLRPVVEPFVRGAALAPQQFAWLALLDLSLAVLITLPLLFLVTRIFGLRSPFDGKPPVSE